MKRLVLAVFLILTPIAPKVLAISLLPADTQQLIVVVSPTWSSSQAHVFLCSKKGSRWEKGSLVYDAAIGKKGMGIGDSLPAGAIEPADSLVPVKKEGDMKTPAGVFELGPWMGYADKLPFESILPYQQTLSTFQGVDDPHSKYYNQIVDTQKIPAGSVDWKTYEVMKRPDVLYKWLMVIKSNPRYVPGEGSMVFMHVWRAKGKGTAGCTAMEEANLLSVFKWLDLAKHPLVVQMPLEAYQRFQTRENLPAFEDK